MLGFHHHGGEGLAPPPLEPWVPRAVRLARVRAEAAEARKKAAEVAAPLPQSPGAVSSAEARKALMWAEYHAAIGRQSAAQARRIAEQVREQANLLYDQTVFSSASHCIMYSF
jgi:hypothetical protein